jgi:ketosteroid isomerase-like protein
MKNDSADDKKAIQELYQTRNIAVHSGDRDSYVATLDENVRMVPPGAKDVIGRDAYAEFLIPVMQDGKFEIIPRGDLEITVLGDIALTRYDYLINVYEDANKSQDGAQSQESTDMKYCDVLRRQEDGTWKILLHMWNENC